MELRRLDDIHCHRYVISVDMVEHGTALAITHDDSSVSFYDPRGMSLFNGMDDGSTVTCLTQAGYQYPMETPGRTLNMTHIPSAILLTHHYLQELPSAFRQIHVLLSLWILMDKHI